LVTVPAEQQVLLQLPDVSNVYWRVVRIITNNSDDIHNSGENSATVSAVRLASDDSLITATDAPDWRVARALNRMFQLDELFPHVPSRADEAVHTGK
jgi:hypothetical protein